MGFVRWSALMAISGMFATGGMIVAAEVDLGESLAQVFKKHCVQCHGKNGKVKGDVDLLGVESAEHLLRDPDLLQALLDVIDFNEMPPDDEPPLPGNLRSQMLTSLETLLDRSLEVATAYPSTPIRRMNRFQYNNAVQDLFELKVEVFSLPERMCREHDDYFQPATGKMPEIVQVGSRPLGKSQLIEKRLGGVAAFPQDLRAENGYDNRGDHLTLSPLLMESFLRLGKSIVESHDFNEKTCGVWNDYFAEPKAGDEADKVVRSRMERFLTHAFRGPVENEVLDRYSNYVIALLADGKSFPASMKEAMAAALASPRFLYLYDQAADQTGVSVVDDFELATRLSFFLWGSIPDQRLLKLAKEERLHDPTVLNAEVERMLCDEKLKRFCDSFPAQWLQLERIVTSVPDRDLYSEFYFAKYRTSMHMMLEPLLLFETLLVEDQSILKLIDSDFSYRSDRLRRWYGEKIDNGKNEVTKIAFKRVPVTDRREGGVITNAAVMTMTSGTKRTHPITRGAWIAAVVFNDPPEPPPANVPPLKEDGLDVEKMTLRERFAAHRKQAACAGCHEKIDPLGFALENFGPAGEWREVYGNGREVDASGSLFRRHEFHDVVEFKDSILEEKDRFVRAFAGHLLSFALGRELEVVDNEVLDEITAKVIKEEYGFHSLIHAIVNSETFGRKFTPPEEASVAEK